MTKKVMNKSSDIALDRSTLNKLIFLKSLKNQRTHITHDEMVNELIDNYIKDFDKGIIEVIRGMK